MQLFVKLFSLSIALMGPFALAEAGPAAQNGITQLIPLVAIFAIFYFLIIRPQQKKAKLHQQFLTELKRGDMVVTASGIIGTIKTLSDRFVTLEVDTGVCMKVVRHQISENANSLKEDGTSK
jgi:preprotein translocase subunit YajC